MNPGAAQADGPTGSGVEAVDLLLRHGHIITMDTERRIVLDGAIAIRGGRIVAVGPDWEIASAVRASTVRDLGGGLVHPGLIDAHVHAGWSELARGYAPKRDGDMCLIDMFFIRERAPEADHLGALLSSMEMVANGITTFCDTGSSFHLDEVARAIEGVGLRGMPGYLLMDTALEGGTPDPRGTTDEEVALLGLSTDECLARLEEQLATYPFQSSSRVRCAVSLYGSGRASDRLLQEGRQLAEQHRAPMVLHWLWAPDEVEASLVTRGRTPVEHLADLGVLGPNLTLVHMIHLAASDVSLIAESGTRVVFNPAASMRRGMGALRVGLFPEMVAAGVTVALGSDGYSGRRDLLRQAYLAVCGIREVRNDIRIFTAETALEMATINGARALNMDDEIGSLEPGKRADIVIHGRNRPEAHPVFQDPVDSLVFYRGSATVTTVLVDGEVILDDGRYTRFDAQDAYRRIDAQAARFEAELGPRRYAEWPHIR